MSLEKYLNPQSLDQDKEFNLPLLIENTEEPHLDTLNHEGEHPFELSNIEDPKAIILKVALEPKLLLLQEVQPRFRFISRDVTYETIRLSDMTNNPCLPYICTGFQLRWLQEGSQRTHQGEDTLDETLREVIPLNLYERSFPLVQGLTTVQDRLTEDGAWRTTATGWEEEQTQVPIIPLGGYIDPGMNLSLIQPLYATLTHDGSGATSVAFQTQSYWQRRGVTVNSPGGTQGRGHRFLPLPADANFESLECTISSGGLCFENDAGALYASQKFKVVDPQRRHIEITFYPK